MTSPGGATTGDRAEVVAGNPLKSKQRLRLCADTRGIPSVTLCVRGPAYECGGHASPSYIYGVSLLWWMFLISEATCGGAQRNHTSVAGGESSEGWKPLKNKGLSRRQIPLQSRESPVCLQITGRLAPDATGECRAPTQIPKNRAAPQGQPGFFHHIS